MSESGWASGTVAPPIEGEEGVRTLTPAPHERDADDHGAPDSETPDSPETERTPEHQAHSGAPRVRIKREARFGLAALLSFLILVSILIINKGHKGRHTPPPNQIPAGPALTSDSPDQDSSNPGTGHEGTKPAQVEGDAPPVPSPALGPESQADAPAPEPHPGGPTVESGHAAPTEGEPASLPYPTAVSATGPAEPLPDPSETTPPLPAASSPPLATEPGSQPPAPAEGPMESPPVPMSGQESNPASAPTREQAPQPVQEPTPTQGNDPAAGSSVALPPPEGSGPSQVPSPMVGSESPTPSGDPATPQASSDPPSEVHPSAAGPPSAGELPAVVDPAEPPGNPEPGPTPQTTPAVENSSRVEPTPVVEEAPKVEHETVAEPTPKVEPTTAGPSPNRSEVLLPSARAGVESHEEPVATPSAPLAGTVPARADELPNFARTPAPSDPVTLKSAGASGEQGTWVALPNAGSRRAGADGTSLRDSSDDPPSPPPKAQGSDEGDHVEPVPHTVKSGENFWTISRLYYGSGRYYLALWQANRRLVPDDPKNLRVGMTIRIPPPEALDRSLIASPARAPVASSSPAAPLRMMSRSNPRAEHAHTATRRTSEIELALPVAEPLAERTPIPPDEADSEFEPRYRPRLPVYKVRSYETVRSIARDTLGDSRRAPEILRLNQDVIDDPNQLTPGQIIQLPEDARLGRRVR